jgi:hypothetical protein
MGGMGVESVPVLKARMKVGVSSMLPSARGRGLPQLRAAYPGLEPDELGRRLVAAAGNDSAAVGRAAALSSLTPLPMAAPLVMAGESAAVTAARMRLTAELGTVYGFVDPSPVNEGATGHLAQWASRDTTGAQAFAVLPALILAAMALPRKLRQRLRLRALLTRLRWSAG